MFKRRIRLTNIKIKGNQLSVFKYEVSGNNIYIINRGDFPPWKTFGNVRRYIQLLKLDWGQHCWHLVVEAREVAKFSRMQSTERNSPDQNDNRTWRLEKAQFKVMEMKSDMETRVEILVLLDRRKLYI